MATVPIYNATGKQAEKLEVPNTILGNRINTNVLHQVVVMYQASQRQGTASTKERADVSGGGKKPYRQKGTGQARAGSRRSPLWKGGGITFGPHPRDFRYVLPKKIRTAALRESLNAKYQDKELFCVDQINVPSAKTKDFAKILSTLKLTGKVLALLDGCDDGTLKASRNIPRLQRMRVQDVNALDVMQSRKVLLTKSAFEKLLKRLK